MNSNYDKLVHGEYCFELPSVILSLVPSLFWKVKWSEFRGALHIVTKHFSWKLDTLEGKSLCYVIFYNDPAYIPKNNFSVNFISVSHTVSNAIIWKILRKKFLRLINFDKILRKKFLRFINFEIFLRKKFLRIRVKIAKINSAKISSGKICCTKDFFP